MTDRDSERTKARESERHRDLLKGEGERDREIETETADEDRGRETGSEGERCGSAGPATGGGSTSGFDIGTVG